MRTLHLSPAFHRPRVPSGGLHGLREDAGGVTAVCDRVPELLADADLSLLARFADLEGCAFDEDVEHQVGVASLTADFQIEDDAAEGQEGTFEGTRGDGSEEGSEEGGARP